MSGAARPTPAGYPSLPVIRLGDPAAVWPTICPNPRCGLAQLHRDDDRIVCLICSTQAAWGAPGLDPLQRYVNAAPTRRRPGRPRTTICVTCGLVPPKRDRRFCGPCEYQRLQERKERAG